MLKSLAEETLDVWREAERLLKRLSPLEPEHEAVRHVVIEMRTMYAALNGEQDGSDGEAASRARIAQARELLTDLART